MNLLDNGKGQRPTAAVIGGTEDCYKGPVIPEFISVLHNHMGPTYEIHVIPNEEIVDNAFAKAIANASLVILPI
jgi:hypothetical protein